MKRLTAILLSILMLLVLLPASAVADGGSQTTDSLRAAGDVSIDSTNFPDANFLAFVNDLSRDNPGYFTASEIADITDIDCGYRGIESLQGIELFTSLERLNCQDNELDSIDVSGMPSLKVLDCHSNPLTGTIAFHENLEELECWNSQIEGSRVTIPANSALRVIKVDASEFGDLSVLNGLSLETLDCPYHDYGTLDFTAWPTLRDFRCDSCSLTSLTVAGLADLTRIRANDNDLTSIDLSGLTSLTELYINDNHIAELDLPTGVTLDGAELDQRIKGQMLTDNGDGTYSFDLGTLVTNLGNVTIQTAGATLSNGVVTFTSQEDELVYTYDIGDANFPMQVTVEFGVAPVFKTNTLVLSGQIGVTFYMDLSCLSDEEKEASYMEFTVNGRTERADYDPNNTNPSKGVLYGFTCSIASVEMAEEITAVYHYGEGETTETTYSAQEYIETAQQTPDYPSEALALVYAIADYGYYVQTFLADVYGWTLGEGDDQYAQMGQCYTESYDVDAIKAAVADYGIVRENNSDDIEKITYSLRLDSETAILVYFKPVKNYNGRFTVTLDDESYTATKQGDGRYLVEIPNIGAHLLGRTYTIAVTTDAGSATVAVAALSYVKGMLAAYVGVTNAENAACAIYAYYAAAAAYMAES